LLEQELLVVDMEQLITALLEEMEDAEVEVDITMEAQQELVKVFRVLEPRL
jgi:hypothetical protein